MMRKALFVSLFLIGCTTVKDRDELISFDRGHSLHFIIKGRGPSVVLESGFGSGAEQWSDLHDRIAQFARVAAYDRAGLGNSTDAPPPRTASRIATELHSALHAAHLAPPYLLVAHSAGAANIRLFAHLYPNEVSAILLIDPPQEEFLDWLADNVPGADAMPPERLAKMPAGIRAEWDARNQTIDELRKAWPLPGVPLVLLTSANNDDALAQQISPEAKSKLIEAREHFLARVPGARQVVATKSGHNIPHDEPQLVVDLIRELVKAK
jgi:pimeloyl-ACP methyl ester carboxylesterase